MLKLQGKNVLITGGSRGIGAAAVKLFAGLGAQVSFNYYKNFRAAEELVKACAHLDGKVHMFECDVSDFQDVQKFVNRTFDTLGSIDILVNNAGIWEYGKIEEMSIDNWRRTMQINLDSVYYFCHLVVKHMKAQKIKGNIINIASTAGQRGEAFYSHYAATKGAMISFTKSLATELGKDGIRVNCVAPGWVVTDMTREALTRDGTQIRAQIPLGYVAEPQDIAAPIVFLASDWARAITGEILNVNCGNVLCG